VLAGQNCKLNVFQKSTGVYLNVFLNNSPIVLAGICRDRVRVIRTNYQGFVGDFGFVDTQGVSKPDYRLFGTRFILAYVDADEIVWPS
jgi:hypothetical protein